MRELLPSEDCWDKRNVTWSFGGQTPGKAINVKLSRSSLLILDNKKMKI